ncbi:MAG: tRNA-2-methylthio-N(6)-dimethylallyladenosine synthase, partial [Bacteroidota bacterium]
MQDLKVLTKEEKDGLDIPRISEDQKTANSLGKKVYIESYGCQMNFADSEVVTSILLENGYSTTSNLKEAETILLNTCAIRENAEHKIRHRLQLFTHMKVKNPGLTIGILGCMAERLKTKLIDEEKIVDLVAGPDA